MTLTVAKLADTLQTVFTTTAEQAACDSRLIKRPRLLTGAAFVQGLVFTWLSNPQATYEELASGVADAGSALAVSSFEERFTPEAAQCLRLVLEQAASQLLSADDVLVPALDAFSDVFLDDSSSIALPAALAEVWPGCGGSTPESCPAALKIYPRISLRHGGLVRLQLTSGRTADQSSDVQSAAVVEGALRVADLGFFDLAAMQRQDRQGGYFLSKVQPGTLLSDPDGEFTGLLTHLEGCDAATLDKPILLGKSDPVKCRLLAVRLPRAIVKRRRARVRKEAARKGRKPSKQALALCAWLVLVSNAPLGKLSLLAAMALYRARWQIELLFRLWKSLGEIDQSRSGKPYRVLTEVYAKLLGMVVQHWLLLLSVWRFPDRSLYKAAKRVRGRVMQVLDEMGQSEGLKKVLGRIMESLERYARVQKRQKHPSTFQLLFDPDLLDMTEALAAEDLGKDPDTGDSEEEEVEHLQCFCGS